MIHQDNAGPYGARNSGLRGAQGSLVTFLTWAPEKLAAQVEAARSRPESGLVALDGIAFSSAGVTRDTLYGTTLARLLADSEGTARHRPLP